MKYTLGNHIHGETNKSYPTLKIEKPFEKLGILASYDNLEELCYFIEWLEEEVVNIDIPDYSIQGAIIYQPILFGSKKSKIAEIENGEFIGSQEFDTQEFLEVCYAWRDFLQNGIKQEL